MEEWISIKNRKPDRDIKALVCNEKDYMDQQIAIYHKNFDSWVLYNPSSRDKILLDVTHYIEIPPIRFII